MGKIPSEERFSNGPYFKAFLLMLVLAQVTWPIRSIIAARRCNDACYRNTEMYCKVFYGGRVATCVKCEVPCSSHRQEDQKVCAEFCKDSQYHASTETSLEEHSPAESVHEMSTLSTLSDAPSTNVLTSEQLTTNLLSMSMATQNMTMAVFENGSVTANTTSEFRGRHGRKKYTVDVFSFFLCIFVLLGFSALVVCLGSYVAKWMGVTFETSKLRPVQSNKNEYEFVPLQGNAKTALQDQSMAEQESVTRHTPQVTFQTAFPSVQTVLSQPSDLTNSGQVSHTYGDEPRSVRRYGSAKCMEGQNNTFTPRDEHNCKTVIPDDPAGKLAAASSCENCSLEVKN